MDKVTHNHICSLYKDCSYYKQLKRLQAENEKLKIGIEKCLENAGIECDDEEQALRTLPIIGSSLYKCIHTCRRT